MQRRSLAVGHFFNGDFKATVERNLKRVREVFFAWPGVVSCRPAPEFTPELRERMADDLRWARANGVELDTLFNANCYGDIAISTELADFVVRSLDEMDAAGLFPDTLTTTSPFIAAVLRRRRPGLKIRWSVNLRVHGSVGLESVEELFDSFYVSRERHRDLAFLAQTREWADRHGKTVGMQANSGCIRQCPFQTFHDNLHGPLPRRLRDQAPVRGLPPLHLAAAGGPAGVRGLRRRRQARDPPPSLSREGGGRLCRVFLRRQPRRADGSRARFPEVVRQPDLRPGRGPLAPGAQLPPRRRLRPLWPLRRAARCRLQVKARFDTAAVPAAVEKLKG